MVFFASYWVTTTWDGRSFVTSRGGGIVAGLPVLNAAGLLSSAHLCCEHSFFHAFQSGDCFYDGENILPPRRIANRSATVL